MEFKQNLPTYRVRNFRGAAGVQNNPVGAKKRGKMKCQWAGLTLKAEKRCNQGCLRILFLLYSFRRLQSVSIPKPNDDSWNFQIWKCSDNSLHLSGAPEEKNTCTNTELYFTLCSIPWCFTPKRHLMPCRRFLWTKLSRLTIFYDHNVSDRSCVMVKINRAVNKYSNCS